MLNLTLWTLDTSLQTGSQTVYDLGFLYCVFPCFIMSVWHVGLGGQFKREGRGCAWVMFDPDFLPRSLHSLVGSVVGQNIHECA